MIPLAILKRRRRSAEDEARPNITSLADVTLVLLVIFLVSASAAVEWVKLKLPDAANTASRDINLAVTLSVTRDGKYYFEDEATSIEGRNLWLALTKIRGNSAWPMAMIRADEQTPLEHIALLVQCLQGMGVDELSFVMQDKEGQQ